MIKFSHMVTDPNGIHARNAAGLMQEALKYQSSILLRSSGKDAMATDIMAVMSLHVRRGHVVELEIDGSDEETAYQELTEFVKEHI